MKNLNLVKSRNENNRKNPIPKQIKWNGKIHPWTKLITLLILLNSLSLKAQNLSLRISHLIWDNSSISEYYGTMNLVGLGISKNLSEDFKTEIIFDYGVDEEDGLKLIYSQFGGNIKYSWYTFGSQQPNFYGGIGGKLISLKESYDGDSEGGNAFGFALLAGIEIPLGENSLLDLGWQSNYCQLEIYEENLNVGNMIFQGGIIFMF